MMGLSISNQTKLLKDILSQHASTEPLLGFENVTLSRQKIIIIKNKGLWITLTWPLFSRKTSESNKAFGKP